MEKFFPPSKCKGFCEEHKCYWKNSVSQGGVVENRKIIQASKKQDMDDDSHYIAVFMFFFQRQTSFSMS